MLGLFAPILITLVCTIAGLWLTWRYCRRGRREASPAICAACGMAATTLTASFACPGCGRDVRMTGLTPARVLQRGWLHPVVCVTLWTAALALAATIYVSSRDFRRSGDVLRKEMAFAPPPGQSGLQSATITLDASRPQDGGVLTGSATVTLVSDTTFATMDVDVLSKQATVTGDGTAKSPATTLSDDTFDALARAAQLDPADQQTHQQSTALHRQFERMLAEAGGRGDWSVSTAGNDNVFSSMSGSSTGSAAPARSVSRWPIAAAAGVWFAGVWAGFVRGGRMARARTFQASTPASTRGAR